jgi:uncharacterized membrane protein YfhO
MYSFYVGMGSDYLIDFPVEPFGWLQFAIYRVGIWVWGADFFIIGRFHQIFIYRFFLTGLVFFFYLRTISIRKFPALIGSLIITFSGFMVVGSSWGFSSHIFKAAFLLFSFEQLFVKKRWYFFPFAVIFLSDNLYVLYLYSLFLLIYMVFRFLISNSGKFVDFITLSGSLIILGIAGILMNFKTVVQSAVKMIDSPRVSGNASYNDILENGDQLVDYTKHHATLILRFFSSDILGTGSNFEGWNNYLEAPLFYIGLITLLLTPQIFVFLNKRNKIIFGSFLGFWLLSIAVPYFRYAILAFMGDYYRYGFDFFIPFVFLLYAIYVLNEMDKGFKLNYKLLSGTLALLLILLFFPYKSIPLSSIDNSIRIFVVLFLMLYVGFFLLHHNTTYKKYAQIGLIAAVCIELGFLSFNSFDDRDPLSRKEYLQTRAGYADGTSEAVKYLHQIDLSPFYRIEKDYQSGDAVHSSLNDAQAQGYYGTARYTSFSQLNYIRFQEETGIIKKGDEQATRWNRGFKNHPLLQTLGSVKYHFSKTTDPLFEKFGFDSIATIDSVKILKNRYYLPFGFTYDKYIDFSDFLKLRPFDKQIAFLNGFVFENDEFTYFEPFVLSKLNNKDSSIFVNDVGFNFELYKKFTDSLKIDTLTITSFRQDNIKGNIHLDKPKVLFFSIPYNEGWQIKVDGKKEKFSRINIGFTGILLTKGDHKIELNFTPLYYSITSLISWASVVLFWLYLGYYIYTKKKKKAMPGSL